MERGGLKKVGVGREGEGEKRGESAEVGGERKEGAKREMRDGGKEKGWRKKMGVWGGGGRTRERAIFLEL